MPGSKSIKPRAALDKDQRNALAESAKKFTLNVRKDGTDLLINGSVTKVTWKGGAILADVQNKGKPCHVVWKELGTGWQDHCTCDTAQHCCHSYAAAHHVLQYGIEEQVEEAEATMNDQIDRLLAMVSHPRKASKNGHGTSTKSVVVRMLEARNLWDAQQHLPALFHDLGIKENAEDKEWVAFVDEAEPRKRAWMLTRKILKHTDRLPEELEDFRNCDQFERDERKRREEGLLESIQLWVQNMPRGLQRAERSIRVMWSWDSESTQCEGPKIQVLMTGKKLKDSHRTLSQLRTFAAEVLYDQHLFNADDAYFLRWLETCYSQITKKVSGQETEVFLRSDYALLEWLTTWGHTDRCEWENGSKVQYDDRLIPLRPHLVTTAPESGKEGGRTPAPHLEFVADLPDGRVLPMSALRIVMPQGEDDPQKPVFICEGNTFYRVLNPPPSEVLKGYFEIGNLTLNKERRTRLLPDLLRSFPRLAETSGDFVRFHPVKLLFSFSLLPTDWLCIRLRADSIQGALHWEFSGKGWIKISSQPSGALHENPHAQEFTNLDKLDGQDPVSSNGKKDAEGVLKENGTKDYLDDFPDPRLTQPAQDWLERLGVVRAMDAGWDHDEGWWLHIDSQCLDQFLEDWKHRPAGVDYWGNPSFRSLVTRSRHAAPRLKIRSSGMDWFSVSAEWAAFISQLTAKDLEQLEQGNEKFVRLSSGHWIEREEAKHLKTVLDTFSELGLDPTTPETQNVSVWQLATADEDTVRKLTELAESTPDSESAKTLQKLKSQIGEFKGIPDVSTPTRLQANMRAYQVEGLKFLSYISSLKLGAILADDMGLGKTLQALSWLELLRDQQGAAPSLVICPASVVHNWCREAQKFVPGSKVLLLTSGEERHGLRKEIPKHDLVVTNYALLRRDLAELKQFEFRAIVLDEAQNIKNPDSRVAQAAKELVAIHRLALTGTPLENRLLDLWSIVDFVAPGYLGNRTNFAERYDVPEQPHRRRMLKARLRPILLRRIKKEVAPDLPDRIEERHDCVLSEGQRKLYVTELNRVRDFVKDLKDQEVFQKQKIHVLAALTRLRQICCHPGLVDGDQTASSGKTDALFEIVEPLVAGGHKVLIFSQFVQMLNLLEKDLKERNINYHVLTGRTTKREAVVEAFVNDPNPSVFLLSLRAAGTGLNLTAASYVILYDPWWNPAVEAQAIDRTHRIGQDRTVITYRLVTNDTVEDKIYKLQQSKSAMVKDVLGEEGFGRNLTREDLDFIFSE